MESLGVWLNTYEAYIALIVLGVMIVAFIVERLPPTSVAIIGAASCLSLGLIPHDEVLKALSNTAPITIAALFILTSALTRTGVLARIGRAAVNLAGKSRILALGVLMAVTVVASAFINNTAIVIVSIPIVVAMADKMGISKRRLLIPLSYLTILGGTLTLIGTSTNLIVAGVAKDAGLERFTIFELSAIGLAVLAAGLVVLVIFGPFLLPNSDKPGHQFSKPLLFLTDLHAPALDETSKKIKAENAGLDTHGMKIVSRAPILEGNDPKPDLVAPGERVSARGLIEDLLTLVKERHFRIGVTRRTSGLAKSEKLDLVESVIAPNDPNIGRRVDELSYLSLYPISVRGIARHGHEPGPQLASTKLRSGDRLLIEGAHETIDALATSTPLIIDREIAAQPYRRDSAHIAIMTIILVIATAALGFAPLYVTALIGFGVVLASGCIRIEDAWKAMDGNVLGLIVAMLIVGAAMQSSGAIDLIVKVCLPVFENLSPFLALVAIYALTSFLTEIITNAAVAVIMTPIVIGLAAQIGVEPRPLVVAVMFAASASFASPVGYQTNTLVYAAGGYRFYDFLKIGLIMNLVVGAASCFAIAWFYGI